MANNRMKFAFRLAMVALLGYLVSANAQSLSPSNDTLVGVSEAFDRGSDFNDHIIDDYIGTQRFSKPLNDRDQINLDKLRFSKFFDRWYESLLSKNYVRPNERNPGKVAKILEQAPSGIYLSVGTERGFIGASLAKNASGLLLVDANPDVVLFNKLNIALLKLSSDLKDYQWLRAKAKPEDWVSRALRASHLTTEERRLISDPKAFFFWGNRVRSFFFLKPYSMWAPFPTFWRAHYVSSKERFAKLQEMAKNGKVTSIQANLGDSEQMDRLASTLRAGGSKLGVLDISNAWWDGYIPRDNLERTLEQLGNESVPDALLVITGQDRSYGYLKQVWNYYGFRMKEIVPLARAGQLDRVLNGEREIKGFQVEKVQDLSRMKVDPIASKVAASREIDVLEYFRRLTSFKSPGEIDGFTTRFEGWIGAKTNALTPEEEEKLVRFIRERISSPGEEERIYLWEKEWFDLRLAERHPEIVEDLLKDGRYRRYLITHALPRFGANHPEWIERMMKDERNAGDIVQHVFPKWWVERHSDWIDAYLKRGGFEGGFAYFVLKQPWTRHHPEWVEMLIKSGRVSDLTIDNYVLSRPHWKNHPDLRRLANRGKLSLSSAPTATNLRAAFARGETFMPNMSGCAEAFRQLLHSQ